MRYSQYSIHPLILSLCCHLMGKLQENMHSISSCVHLIQTLFGLHSKAPENKPYLNKIINSINLFKIRFIFFLYYHLMPPKMTLENRVQEIMSK